MAFVKFVWMVLILLSVSCTAICWTTTATLSNFSTDHGEVQLQADPINVEYENFDLNILVSKNLIGTESKSKALNYILFEFWGCLRRQVEGFIRGICERISFAIEAVISPRSVLYMLISQFLNRCTDCVFDALYSIEAAIGALFQEVGTRSAPFDVKYVVRAYMILKNGFVDLNSKLRSKKLFLFYATATGRFFVGCGKQLLQHCTYDYFDRITVCICDFIQWDFLCYGLLMHLINTLSSYSSDFLINLQIDAFDLITECGVLKVWLSLKEKFHPSSWIGLFDKCRKVTQLRSILSIAVGFLVMETSKYMFRCVNNSIEDVLDDQIATRIRAMFSFDSFIYVLLMYFLREFLDKIADVISTFEYVVRRAVKDLMTWKTSNDVSSSRENYLKYLIDEIKTLLSANIIEGILNFAIHYYQRFFSNIEDEMQSTFTPICSSESVLYRTWMYFFEKYKDKSIELLNDTAYELKAI